MLRNLEKADIAQILAIYAFYVKNTAYTLELEIPSYEQFEKRCLDIQSQFPFVVYIENNQVLAYAYASKFRERAAYKWVVETSIYVAEAHQGKAIARLLYLHLFEKLVEQGFFHAIGVISLPNEKSVSFHKKMGFVQAAEFKKIGFKHGIWHNVGFWHKQLVEGLPLVEEK